MKVILIVLGLSLISATQLTPIPSKAEGLGFGNPHANYTLDVYYDFLCSDSAADYPGLKEFVSENSDRLYVKVHIFALPYHLNSFYVAQVGKYIEVNYPEKFQTYLEFMFANQKTYLVEAQNWDLPTIFQTLANDTNKAVGIDSNEVLKALQNSEYNWATRVSWKYACSRAVTGTPQYFVNDVLVPDASNFTSKQDWDQFFSNLLDGVAAY